MAAAANRALGAGKVELLRSGRLAAPENAPSRITAEHRDETGQLLPPEMAAIEFINVLRPPVAVDRFITFAALALYQYPQASEKLRDGADGGLEAFAQEVRRYFPFFPTVGGRAREAFSWRDRAFARGGWVLLDIYGTNRDPRIWEEPEAFRPERFAGREVDPYELIPQGGGEHRSGHRCPGELITLALVKRALRLLTTAMSYHVPPQDLRIPLNRFPTLPNSRFVITNVRTRR